MKKSFYQWLLRAVLALTCLLTTTSAWAGFNIYVKPYSSNYCIHTWGGTIQTNNGSVSNSTWPGTTFNGNFSTQEIGGTTWYVVPVTSESINYILNVGSNQHQTGNLSANSTIFVRYGENATAIEDVTSQYIDYVETATWTVAGEPAALFGTTWAPANTANDMTSTDGVNYTWSKENVDLTSGTAKFKVVKNHSWDNPSYPGSDYVLSIPSNGTYNVTITFNSNTKDVNATIEAVATTPDEYTIVGSNSTLFGTAWDTSNTANNMTETTSGVYTLTKSNVELSAGNIEYKAVKNHDYNNGQWPNGNANNTLNIPQDGLYNVTFTLNISTNELTAVATPQFATTPVFSLASGTYDTNQNVTITAGGTIYYTTDGTDPETSETRIAYYEPISIAGEGEHVIKAVSIVDGNASDVVTAEYVIKYQNIYLFGSVGKAHAWVYNYSNPELVTSDGVNYSGVANVNVMTDYHRSDNQPVGLFMLTKGFGSNWETTEPMMIGTTSTTEDNHYWIDGGSGHFGEWLDTRPGSENAGNGDLHTNGWSLPAGTYEFFYNGDSKQLMVTAFDGPTIYVYDYTRPYIYVEDKDGKPFDGVQPGNPIQTLDETVGGHSGLSTAGDGTGDGNGTLGWYKFAVPVHPANCPVKFQFHHNGDKKVVDSEMYETSSDAYYYWDGAEYKPIAKADANKLRRIVAHVRVQGTTVPSCDNQPMNGPSSFYGQMYYWMAVTTYDKGENVVISDGTHHYEGVLYSDIYLEWTDENANYNVLSQSTLENRLATKTGRGTVIHLLKNKNTPTNNGDYVLGIDTEISSNGMMYNSTNVGTTWWGNSISSPWAGTESYHDGTIISNYNNSRFLYAADGLNGNPDVFTITAENGTEWYTWYSDRSTATIRFGYGTPKEGYPSYLTGGEGAPAHPEGVFKFFANYESPQTQQTAGELWYVWTPDFNAALNGSQSQNNGELIDVTRTYESRAKQKALCSTFRDGNYVYYTDIKGWGDNNVYCYAWTVPGLEWPGVQMVKVGYDDEGHPVYLADLSNFNVSNATGIIFNNGHDALETDKRQTGDLPFENQGCYDYLGLLYRIGGNVDVIENEPDGFPTSVTLTGVWYSRVRGTLLAKGNNDYNNKSVNGMGYKDFAKTVNAGNDDGSVLQSRDYDQSNWVEIYPSEDGLVDTETLIGLIGKPFTLYGTKTNSVNPTFTAISISNVGSVGEKYQPNHFTPIHLNGSCYQYRTGENEWYFFVEPKPNEFAIMDWATYHEDSDGHEYFYTPSNTGFDGEFVIDWSYFDKFNLDGEAITALEPYQMDVCGQYPGKDYLHEGASYKGWYAIVKVNQSAEPADDVNTKAETGSIGKYTVCPVYLSDEQIMTAIETINADKASGMRTLKATRYYNMMGVESSTPFQGVNIIVKEYTDGSRESSKVIMK
ncbi:MAG: chitobiase/beta-hexosaminidase C-terminal domain-containing protein [Muribaculaceae bacterium]|nr:chitobiase/beta-hexosaminidase C-terminal domain-containing protein [Muribaculaceae bacterium]